MYNVSKSEFATRARDIMQGKIDKGRASAAALLEHVNSNMPMDSIVKTGALEFAPDTSGVRVAFGGESRGIHRHALGQMAAKAGIPGAYLAELVSGNEWQKALAANVLNEHFHKGQGNAKYLTRSSSGSVKGFLSDRYRRLDSRPLLEAFATSCQSIGAVPVDGVVSDTRVALKAILPMVFEPVSGEVMCLGGEWGNSDYGAARHTFRAFLLRLTCLNGATMEDALAQVHLGRQLSDDIEFSRRTYELDTRASVSALKDIVAGTLGPAKVNTLLEGIKAADEKKVDWRNLRTQLARRLLKSELQAVESAYQSEDVINLPAGKSLWRASNAVSWIAGHTEDNDRRLELERVAGEVLNGKRDSEVTAEAA